MLLGATADRQERGREGEKYQKNMRKKVFVTHPGDVTKAGAGLLIQHFVPHPWQSKGSRKAGLQEWHNTGTSHVPHRKSKSE
jgi:hypothetical protein